MAWNNEPQNVLIVHVSDYSGNKATSQYNIDNTEVDPGGGAAAAIADGIQDISAGWVSSVEILRHATNDAPGTPTDGPYCRPADAVDLEFTAEDGSITTMTVQGPNETILGVDNEHVDAADPALAAFVTYAKANFVSSEGAALIGLTRGVRVRHSGRKHQ